MQDSRTNALIKYAANASPGVVDGFIVAVSEETQKWPLSKKYFEARIEVWVTNRTNQRKRWEH